MLMFAIACHYHCWSKEQMMMMLDQKVPNDGRGGGGRDRQ